MVINQNIKKFRKAKKLTQKQLAELIHKNTRTIQKYEEGSIIPPVEVIKEIAKTLDVAPIDILGPGNDFDSMPKTEEEKRIVGGVYNTTSLDELIYSDSELIKQQKENILYSIRELAKASNISLEKRFHFEEKDLEALPFEYHYEYEKTQFVDIKYKDINFSLTEEDYNKLVNRIIELIAINILASKDYRILK